MSAARDRLILYVRALRRSQAILDSETLPSGRVKPINRWSRSKRREFARLAAKIDRMEAQARARSGVPS